MGTGTGASWYAWGMRAASLATAALLLSVACSSGSKGGTTPGNRADSGGPDYRKSIADPLGFLPVDAEVVVSIDVAALRRSPAWERFVPSWLAKLPATYRDMQAKCGFQVLDEISSVTFAARRLDDGMKDGVARMSGLERARVRTCIERLNADGHAKVTIDGEVYTQRADDGTTSVFTFVDDRTIVMIVGASVDKAALGAVLASTASLRSSPAFVELFGFVDTKAGVWFALNGNSPAAAQLGAYRPKWAVGSLTLDAGMRGNMRARFASEDTAREVVAKGQSQLGIAGGFFEKLTLEASGADAVLDAQMTPAQLETAMMMAAGVLGD